MSDLELRRAQRAAADNDPDSLARLLRVRVRAGDLDPERLALAAYCGHPAARLAVEHWEDCSGWSMDRGDGVAWYPDAFDLGQWVQRVAERWGSLPALVACCAAARSGLDSLGWATCCEGADCACLGMPTDEEYYRASLALEPAEVLAGRGPDLCPRGAPWNLHRAVTEARVVVCSNYRPWSTLAGCALLVARGESPYPGAWSRVALEVADYSPDGPTCRRGRRSALVAPAASALSGWAMGVAVPQPAATPRERATTSGLICQDYPVRRILSGDPAPLVAPAFETRREPAPALADEVWWRRAMVRCSACGYEGWSAPWMISGPREPEPDELPFDFCPRCFRA